MASKERFVEAAEELREKKVRVSYRNVNDVLGRDDGVGLSFSDMKVWLREWIEETGYDPIIETAKIPDPLRAKLVRAAEGLWEVAREEATAAYREEKRRAEATVQVERALCDEAAALADARQEVIAGLRREMEAEIRARDEVIETQRNEITWYAAELESTRTLLQDVRASEFWERVVQEIHAILPVRDWMHVRDIRRRIGADLVQEASSHKEPWRSSTIRKKITGRIDHGRLFEEDVRRPNWFRRRRPEDEKAA